MQHCSCSEVLGLTNSTSNNDFFGYIGGLVLRRRMLFVIEFKLVTFKGSTARFTASKHILDDLIFVFMSS